MNSQWNENEKVAYRQRLKSAANDIAEHYFSRISTQTQGRQIKNCAPQLRTYPGSANGTFTDAWYCKHRQCPTCQWRKALKWRSRMHEILDTTPEVLAGKWIYLTLTTRNCYVTDLRATIKEMNAAFQRLKKREFWSSNVIGGIKFIEVDQSHYDEQSAHPHFHCLIQVRPSMHQGNNYVSEVKWAEEWQACLQVYFCPHIYSGRLTGQGDELSNKILSAVSYSMKPRPHTPSRGWFLSISEEMKGMRLIEPFGQMRDWFFNLKFQEDSELQAQREEIRAGHNPIMHRWDQHGRAYRKDQT